MIDRIENEINEILDPASIETEPIESMLLSTVKELTEKAEFLQTRINGLESENNRFKKYLNRYQVAYYSFAQMSILESSDHCLTHAQRKALAEVRNGILYELGIELNNMKDKAKIVKEAADTEIDPIPF